MKLGLILVLTFSILTKKIHYFFAPPETYAFFWKT